MKIEILLFDAQLNAFFTIVKNFSWVNAYAEKCNPQLNAFFTTWSRSWNENFVKHQDSNADAQCCTPYTMVLMFCVCHAKQAPGFTRSLFLISYQRVGDPSY